MDSRVKHGNDTFFSGLGKNIPVFPSRKYHSRNLRPLHCLPYDAPSLALRLRERPSLSRDGLFIPPQIVVVDSEFCVYTVFWRKKVSWKNLEFFFNNFTISIIALLLTWGTVQFCGIHQVQRIHSAQWRLGHKATRKNHEERYSGKPSQSAAAGTMIFSASFSETSLSSFS